MTDFDEDVQKQRRNLLLISVALIIFDFADVSIAKVGILGTDLIIGNPTVLIFTAWLFWLYFLVRYYQYWRIHNAKKISSAYYDYLKSWGHAYIFKKYDQHPSRNFMSIKLRGSNFEIVERRANIRASMDETTVEFMPTHLTLKAKIQAIWHVAIISPHFTDQLFPFVVAVIAPIATIATKLHEIRSLVA